MMWVCSFWIQWVTTECWTTVTIKVTRTFEQHTIVLVTECTRMLHRVIWLLACMLEEVISSSINTYNWSTTALPSPNLLSIPCYAWLNENIPEKTTFFHELFGLHFSMLQSRANVSVSGDKSFIANSLKLPNKTLPALE